MRFRCTVQVQDQIFASTISHAHRKDAEEDAANVAYSALMGSESVESFYKLVKKVQHLIIAALYSYHLV
jgi:hypothetical protein